MNVCVQHHTSAGFPTEISVPIEAEAKSALEQFWTFLEKRHYLLLLPEFEFQIVES
jgi:hypothetical protein